MKLLLSLTTTIAAALATSTPEHSEPDYVLPRVGAVCDIGQGLKVAEVENKYLECKVPPELSKSWSWPSLGLWHLSNCSEGTIFDPYNQNCTSATTIRRQQACGWGGCGNSQPAPLVQPIPQQQTWVPQPSNTCGPQGCQPVQPQYPVVPAPQPAYPAPAPSSPCGPQGCGQPQPMPYVEPIAHIQPVYPPVPVSPCGPQGCQPPPAPIQPVQPVYPVQPMVPAPTNCGPPPAPVPCPSPGGRPQYPKPVVRRPCPQSGGNYCSWMIDPLRAGNGKGYSQCMPVANSVSEFCGRWVPRPCAHGGRFNARAQVCVRDPSVRPRPGPSTACPQLQVPIAPCNAQQQCPGYSTCQPSSNTCCQQPQWSG